MDADLLKILSEELRETRNMVLETRRMADEAQRKADAAQQTANASVRKADAAWEFVIMTRNQIQEELRYMKLPWWKKLVGKAA
jgi:hypothetical protein